MWGFGGKHYWARKDRGTVEGIVVVFAWMSSQEKHLKNYTDLYSSLGWNSLVLHSRFFNLFFPDKAASWALTIMNELVQELKLRPCPVVFASFSGAPKASMYKVLQIIEGKCEEKINLDEYCLVRDSVSGYIFDSSPVDFVRDIGIRFVLHPTVLGMSHPPPFASWIANGIFASIDRVFLNEIEAQRAEYWQTLYSTVSLGAPYLILCSEDDNLAPFQVINNFATRLKDLGADVNLVKWSTSSHVGHFQHDPERYKVAVTELLAKATVIYSQRILQLEGENRHAESSHNEVSDPYGHPRKAAEKSGQSFQKVALDLNDHFLVPSSMERLEDSEASPIQNEHYIPMSSPSRINPHGQFPFNDCVLKNVEDWDLKNSPLTRAPFAIAHRHSPFNPIKFLCRSRF